MSAKCKRTLAALTIALGFVIASWSAMSGAAESDAQQWKAPARAARKKNPIPADDKSLAAGKAVYLKECLSCHGEQGRGDGSAAKDLNPKPRDLRTAELWEQTDGSLFWKLTEGKKPMPSYEKLLSEEDRWNVINYIRNAYAPKDSAAATQSK